LRFTVSRLFEYVNEIPANLTESICREELFAFRRIDCISESAFTVRTREAMKSFG